MTTGIKGFALIKEFESLHDGDLSQIGLQPKMDPVGIWTEGWGHAMLDSKGKFIKGIANQKLAYSLATIHTVEQANAALIADVKPFELWIARRLKIAINQNQYDAILDHTYNTGGSNTLLDLINANSGKDKIYLWFTTRYITGEGIKLPGLVRRRKSEADLYFS